MRFEGENIVCRALYDIAIFTYPHHLLNLTHLVSSLLHGLPLLLSQSLARGWLARRRTDQMRTSVCSAVVIQTAWRGWSMRRQYLLTKQSVVLIQACWRGYQMRKRYGSTCIRLERVGEGMGVSWEGREGTNERKKRGEEGREGREERKGRKGGEEGRKGGEEGRKEGRGGRKEGRGGRKEGREGREGRKGGEEGRKEGRKGGEEGRGGGKKGER